MQDDDCTTGTVLIWQSEQAIVIVNGVFVPIQYVLTLAEAVLPGLTFNPRIAILLCGATIPSFTQVTRWAYKRDISPAER